MEKQLLQEIIQWDVQNWSTALRFWEENVQWNSVHRCLELGGREGGLSLWLALKQKEVVCSDVGDVQQTAERLHTRYGVLKNIHYQSIDATHIPYENHFDLIVFKSILGIIGREQASLQQQAVKEMYKALKPGGTLIFAENLAGSGFHQLLRKKFVNWGRAWRYISVEEIQDYLKIFSSYSIKSTGFAGLLGRTEGQRNMLGKVDKALLNHCVPAHWKYIVYGIAKK